MEWGLYVRGRSGQSEVSRDDLSNVLGGADELNTLVRGRDNGLDGVDTSLRGSERGTCNVKGQSEIV